MDPEVTRRILSQLHNRNDKCWKRKFKVIREQLLKDIKVWIT